MLFPRGSLRSGREALPSRWLLDSAASLAGHPVVATEFPDLPAPVLHTVASFSAGLRGSTAAAGVTDNDLRVLLGAP